MEQVNRQGKLRDKYTGRVIQHCAPFVGRSNGKGPPSSEQLILRDERASDRRLEKTVNMRQAKVQLHSSVYDATLLGQQANDVFTRLR